MRTIAPVLVVLAIGCKPPPDTTCAEATKKLDTIVYAGDTDARTLASHERICDEEGWPAEVRWCLARARTHADLAKCAPDTDATAPILRGIVHETNVQSQ